MKRSIMMLSLLSLLLTGPLKATDKLTTGAKAASLSNAATCLTGIGAAMHNQAGLTTISKPVVDISYTDHFSLDILSDRSICFAIPLANSVWSASYAETGYELWKESRMAMTLAKSFGRKLSVALQFDLYDQYYAEDHKNLQVFIPEFGLQYHTPTIDLGFHLFNPLQAGYHTLNSIEHLPLLINTGVALHPDKNIIIYCDMHYRKHYDYSLLVGTAYDITRQLSLYAGVNARQASYSFGLGYSWHHFNVNISMSNHQQLGLTPAVSLQYHFSKHHHS
ncbi:hypothetical protein EYV94_26815 [Puteibacter caeruleilacunae]|nr:hypothetical protein EYV94_26815 [Puteibacter caeruleilacunae]